jgi:magnesium-dependent phosphatase 1
MQLVVFDLDYTIWQPEMYQLDGPPKLTSIDEFQQRNKKKSCTTTTTTLSANTIFPNIMIITDRHGTTPITIFDGASYALSEINRMNKENMSSSSSRMIKVGISSRTDEPQWARQIMQWLTIIDGTTSLSSCFTDTSLIEISYNDKSKHFESLARKTGIPYTNMAFFDNEYTNIQSVSRLGVKCYYTPHGMTREDWNNCLLDFGIN